MCALHYLFTLKESKVNLNLTEYFSNDGWNIPFSLDIATHIAREDFHTSTHTWWKYLWHLDIPHNILQFRLPNGRGGPWTCAELIKNPIVQNAQSPVVIKCILSAQMDRRDNLTAHMHAAGAFFVVCAAACKLGNWVPRVFDMLARKSGANVIRDIYLSVFASAWPFARLATRAKSARPPNVGEKAALSCSLRSPPNEREKDVDERKKCSAVNYLCNKCWRSIKSRLGWK